VLLQAPVKLPTTTYVLGRGGMGICRHAVATTRGNCNSRAPSLWRGKVAQELIRRGKIAGLWVDFFFWAGVKF